MERSRSEQAVSQGLTDAQRLARLEDDLDEVEGRIEDAVVHIDHRFDAQDVTLGKIKRGLAENERAVFDNKLHTLKWVVSILTSFVIVLVGAMVALA